MATFVHPFAADLISEEEVINNKAFPLLRELAHQYGMRVFCIDRSVESRLSLSRDDGIVLCDIYFDQEKGSFVIRNSVVYKERGRHTEDKLTFFAKKVSFLMKVIKQHEMLPTTTTYLGKVHGNMFRNVARMFADQYDNVRKSTSSMTGDDVHSVLEIALGNRHLSSLSRESMDKIQSVVDKYRDIDKMRIERQRELVEYFDSHLWVLYYDNTNTFGVGKMMLRPTWSGQFSDTLTDVDVGIVEDFRRIKDPTEVAELIPTLAMLKTNLQQSYSNMEFVGESGFFPKSWEGVSPEFRVVGVHGGDRWNRIAFAQPKFLIIPA
jgi:hypothetical protein